MNAIGWRGLVEVRTRRIVEARAAVARRPEVHRRDCRLGFHPGDRLRAGPPSPGAENHSTSASANADTRGRTFALRGVRIVEPVEQGGALDQLHRGPSIECRPATCPADRAAATPERRRGRRHPRREPSVRERASDGPAPRSPEARPRRHRLHGVPPSNQRERRPGWSNLGRAPRTIEANPSRVVSPGSRPEIGQHLALELRNCAPTAVYAFVPRATFATASRSFGWASNARTKSLSRRPPLARITASSVRFSAGDQRATPGSTSTSGAHRSNA